MALAAEAQQRAIAIAAPFFRSIKSRHGPGSTRRTILLLHFLPTFLFTSEHRLLRILSIRSSYYYYDTKATDQPTKQQQQQQQGQGQQ